MQQFFFVVLTRRGEKNVDRQNLYGYEYLRHISRGAAQYFVRDVINVDINEERCPIMQIAVTLERLFCSSKISFTEFRLRWNRKRQSSYYAESTFDF